MSRPGVPTRRSQPAASGVALLGVVDAAVHRQDLERREAPEQPRVGLDLHHQLARRGDDEHARRVGAGGGAGVRSSWVKAAIRKAAVLPVPVCDWPATSLPRSASGSAASWIGVAVMKPASRMPCMTGSGRSREAKSI